MNFGSFRRVIAFVEQVADGEGYWIEVSLVTGEKIIGAWRQIDDYCIALVQPTMPDFFVPLSAIVTLRLHD